jgi:hypothetical protein
MLTGATPVQVLVPTPNAALPTPNTALNEDIKRLLGADQKISAIKLLLQEKKTIGLARAKAYVEAIEKGTDPEQAVAAIPKNANATAWVIVILILGVFSYNSGNWMPRFFDWMNDVPPAASSRGPQPSAQAAPVAGPAPAPAQNTAAAESARAAVAKMVNLGLIKRMDVKTGKFYVDGPLWEGFELDAKENIVKVISAYREAEYKGLPQVTLYESRSGKELASNGAFSGVTLK